MIIGHLRIHGGALLLSVVIGVTITTLMSLSVSPLLGLILSAPVGLVCGVGGQVIAAKLNGE